MGKQIYLDIAKCVVLLEGLRSKLESHEPFGVCELIVGSEMKICELFWNAAPWTAR